VQGHMGTEVMPIHAPFGCSFYFTFTYNLITKVRYF
jgi:hypothetical protein